jgi:hypothetical protein
MRSGCAESKSDSGSPIEKLLMMGLPLATLASACDDQCMPSFEAEEQR